jgi:hypothetical protein
MEGIEEWKDIVDYTNYEVSNLGNVRNKKTGRILKASCKGGYVVVGLCANCIGKTFSVHRLVAKAFIDNPENKPQVNHIDKDGTNNKVSNLEWCTSAEDAAHKLLTLTPKTNQNLKIWRVDMVTGDKLELYNSIYDASLWCANNGYTPSANNIRTSITYAVKGKYKSSCGFKWVLNEQPTLEGEIWKNVNIGGGTIVDNYEVSNLGRFKNSKGVIMENYKPHHTGYIFVRVNKQKYQLHRLVAFTFIENPHSKPVVNHIDGNKTNNALANLEWVTIQENNQHNHNVGLIKVFTRKIGQYNLEGIFIKEYNSIVEAIRETKIKSIKEVLYGNQNTAGGFIWKYLD